VPVIIDAVNVMSAYQPVVRACISHCEPQAYNSNIQSCVDYIFKNCVLIHCYVACGHI